MNQTCDPAAVRFGPFLYEPINGRLLRAGAELGVPPWALAILGCLVQRPGLLVTKQDLLDQVWKDALVTDTSLSEAVSVLRQALGDDAQEPSSVGKAPVTRFTLTLPASQHLASGSSLAVSADGRLIAGVLEDAAGGRGAWARHSRRRPSSSCPAAKAPACHSYRRQAIASELSSAIGYVS